MANSYGENLKLSIFGTSHGPSIGMTLEGIPAGLPVDMEKLQLFLNRRAPGQNAWSTARKEPDVPVFESGIDRETSHPKSEPAVAFARNLLRKVLVPIAPPPSESQRLLTDAYTLPSGVREWRILYARRTRAL